MNINSQSLVVRYEPIATPDPLICKKSERPERLEILLKAVDSILGYRIELRQYLPLNKPKLSTLHEKNNLLAVVTLSIDN